MQEVMKPTLCRNERKVFKLMKYNFLDDCMSHDHYLRSTNAIFSRVIQYSVVNLSALTAMKSVKDFQAESILTGYPRVVS